MIPLISSLDGSAPLFSSSFAGSSQDTPLGLAARIGQLADLKEKQASSSRLHQKQPAALITARDKMEALRRANKPTYIKLDVGLWFWPRGGGAAKRVSNNFHRFSPSLL